MTRLLRLDPKRYNRGRLFKFIAVGCGLNENCRWFLRNHRVRQSTFKFKSTTSTVLPCSERLRILATG